jgi:hypothetical protein
VGDTELETEAEAEAEAEVEAEVAVAVRAGEGEEEVAAEEVVAEEAETEAEEGSVELWAGGSTNNKSAFAGLVEAAPLPPLPAAAEDGAPSLSGTNPLKVTEAGGEGGTAPALLPLAAADCRGVVVLSGAKLMPLSAGWGEAPPSAAAAAAAAAAEVAANAARSVTLPLSGAGEEVEGS